MTEETENFTCHAGKKTAVTPKGLFYLGDELTVVIKKKGYFSSGSMQLGETTDLFLELLAFLWSEGVCFGD